MPSPPLSEAYLRLLGLLSPSNSRCSFPTQEKILLGPSPDPSSPLSPHWHMPPPGIKSSFCKMSVTAIQLGQRWPDVPAHIFSQDLKASLLLSVLFLHLYIARKCLIVPRGRVCVSHEDVQHDFMKYKYPGSVNNLSQKCFPLLFVRFSELN